MDIQLWKYMTCQYRRYIIILYFTNFNLSRFDLAIFSVRYLIIILEGKQPKEDRAKGKHFKI